MKKPKPALVGGILERKSEKLLALGAISTSCDEATYEAIKAGDEKAIMEHYQAITVWVDFALTRVIHICAERLTSQNEWGKLANDRDRFTEALDRTLRAVSIALKLLHSFTDHRPSEHESRDQELFRLKTDNLAWSFGKLQMQYNLLYPEDQISDKQAERSYKQELERVQRKLVRAHAAAKTYLEASSLSEEELFQKLPTPEDVLAILTTK